MKPVYWSSVKKQVRSKRMIKQPSQHLTENESANRIRLSKEVLETAFGFKCVALKHQRLPIVIGDQPITIGELNDSLNSNGLR